MKEIDFANHKALPLDSVPELPAAGFLDTAASLSRAGCRPVQYFGWKHAGRVRLIAVMSDAENGRLKMFRTALPEGGSYPSLTPEHPAFHLFERELHEEFGIVPEGHPSLKPVRYSFDRYNPSETAENYPFYRAASLDSHEVGVGPVHAGIIEPGHFRFTCEGETVHNLEIRLGYQHRGVERLFEAKGDPVKKAVLAESVSGDQTIAHATAYAANVESLTDTRVPRKAMSLRAIALELERMAMHAADLSALAGDVAYLTGNAAYGATRTLIINTLLLVCGNRFGKGLLRPGGTVFDLDKDRIAAVKKILDKVMGDIEIYSEALFTSASVLARFENTGRVAKEDAERYGMVGPAARASGTAVDVRSDHPSDIYKIFPVHKVTMDSGDVFARAYIRYAEIRQSYHFILEQLKSYSTWVESSMKPLGAPHPDCIVTSLVEGFRGETAHTAITGKDGGIVRYKIKDPSFHNWTGLSLALRGTGISDFPVCNKSFNLSYCGFDL